MGKQIYISFLFMLALGGILNFSYLATFEPNKHKLKFKKKSRIGKIIIEEQKVENKEIDAIFDKHGLSISGKQYQIMRYSVVSFFFMMWFMNALLFKKNTSWGMMGIAIFLISIPKEVILKIKTPFYYFFNLYSKSYQKKRDIELLNIVAQMKNIYITLKGNVGTDYVLNEILKFSKYTKGIFIKFNTLWNLNRKDEAVEFFTIASGSDIGRDLAYLIIKLDGLHEHEIIEQLSLYQNVVRQTKETYRNKSQERKTTFYFTLSTILVIAIILNMLVTIIFTNLLEQFRYIL